MSKAKRKHRRKRHYNRLDVIKADPAGDWVYVRTKDGEIHKISLVRRGHYRVAGRIKPGRRKKKSRKKTKR